jgi:hypothetical protein
VCNIFLAVGHSLSVRNMQGKKAGSKIISIKGPSLPRRNGKPGPFFCLPRKEGQAKVSASVSRTAPGR